MRRIGGTVAYSGMLADADSLARELRTKPPVLLLHGDADELMPVGEYHAAKAALDHLGFAVEGHVSPGLAHGIDMDGLKMAERFLREAFELS
jgi:phospholipase/carboxylesterase